MSTFLQLRARGNFHTHDSVTLCDGTDKTLSLMGSTTLADTKTLTAGSTFADTGGNGVQLSDSKFEVKDGGNTHSGVALTIATTGATGGELFLNRTARLQGGDNTTPGLVTNYGISVGSGSLSTLKGLTDLTGNTIQLYGMDGANAASQDVTFSGAGNVILDTRTFKHQASNVTNFTLDASGLTSNVDSTFEKNVTVKGDLLVEGSTVTKNQEEVNIGDNHIYLNASNTLNTAASAGGIVINSKAVGTVLNVQSIQRYTENLNQEGPPGFGNLYFSNGVAANAETIFSEDDIVQISGSTIADQNGLYVVGANVGTNLVKIKEANVKPLFAKTTMAQAGTTGVGDMGSDVKLCKVELGHLLIDDGQLKFATGSTDGDFDHTDSSKYLSFAGSVDHRSESQTITATANTVQHLEKRVVIVTGATSNAIYLPPNTQSYGNSGSSNWLASHRIFNHTTNPITLYSKPSYNGAPAYTDPNNGTWGTASTFKHGDSSVTDIEIAAGESIQVQYVTDGVWATM
jgi:hypothetical protein